MDYIDFELEISPGREDSFGVAVLRSPAGEPRGTLRLPFDERDLELRLLALENALLRSGATHTRRIASPDEAPVQAIGEGLFEGLLNGEILSCYDQSQRIAREQRKGLRLKLRIQAPELAALPWEFLYDPREDEYVGLSRRTPIVRYLEPRRPVSTLKVQPPLRVLGLVSSPQDLDPLDVSTERRRVEESLKELRASGLMDLVWLPGQTWADLQEAKWRGPWHIFHFIGHGGFDSKRDEGVLALCNETGSKRLLTATELGRLLGDHDSLRLAVLNACEGARSGRRDVFSSTAATLVRRGVPAVVAMQYEISDPAAIQFGTRFYAAVAHGMAVDAALIEARISMSVATRESAEWGTPVLHTNAADGQLFELTASVPTLIQAAPIRASDTETAQHLERQWTRALSYFWTQRWEEAAQVLTGIVSEQPNYRDAATKLEEARRQAHLAQLYAAANQAYEARAWSQAIERFEAVVALDPQYRDAAVLLEEVGRQQKLTELYAEARELHHAQAWQGVLNILERIRALDAAYEDSEGLGSAAEEALAAEQRQRQHEALFRQGLAHLEASEWSAAVEVFERLQREQPEYPDSTVLLARARERLAYQEECERQERTRQKPAENRTSARRQETAQGPPITSILDAVSKVQKRDIPPSERVRRFRISFVATQEFKATSMQAAIRQAEALGAMEVTSISRPDDQTFRISFVATQEFKATSLQAAIQQAEALGATNITSIARDDEEEPTRRSKRKLTGEHEREITRLYAETETPIAEIGRRFGISESSVYRVAQRHGAVLRGGVQPTASELGTPGRRKLTEEQEREVTRLYAETETPVSEIGRRFGIGESSVYRIAQRHGAQLRGPMPQR